MCQRGNQWYGVEKKTLPALYRFVFPPDYIECKSVVFVCVCEPWWGFFLECSPPPPSIAQHFPHFKRSRGRHGDPDLWTVELFFCLSVAGGKTAGTHSCMWLLMLRCCVLLFGAGVDFYRNIQRCYCTWTRVFGCCRVGFRGSGRVTAASAPRPPPLPPHGKWSSQYIYTSLKPLLKTDDCSFRAQWISMNILDCSNWLCAIVTMEIQ